MQELFAYKSKAGLYKKSPGGKKIAVLATPVGRMLKMTNGWIGLDVWMRKHLKKFTGLTCANSYTYLKERYSSDVVIQFYLIAE